MKRYYTLCGVIYDDNINCMKELMEYSRHYVVIVHDKDDRDIHIHFIATFPQNISFDRAKSMIHSSGNCFVQPVQDLQGMFAYLTHATSKAVEDGKHKYLSSDLISDNIDYWYNRVSEKEEKTTNKEFIDDLLSADMNIREMGYKYGRDFIKNMNSYLLFRRAVKYEEPDIIDDPVKHEPYYEMAENSPGWVTLKNDENIEFFFEKGVDKYPKKVYNVCTEKGTEPKNRRKE